jgi:peptidoglycan/LPS O-acetylase OafA/YrhL
MAREAGPVQSRFIAGDSLRAFSAIGIIVFHVFAFSTVFTPGYRHPLPFAALARER